MAKWGKYIVLGTLAVFCFGAALSAQETTASVRGTVLDPSGARVPSATVSAIQAETGFTRTGASDADGNYLLVLLPIGHYRLEVTAQGFRKYVQDGISLSVNQVAQVPVRLEVGLPQQTVQVGPNGYYAYVIKPDSTVERRAVEVASMQDGLAVISKGLAAGEQVVIDGQFRLTEGARVRIEPSKSGASG